MEGETLIGDNPLDPDAPHSRREDYATLAAYERAFHLWRALRRDALLTPAESRAKLEALADALDVPRKEWTP